MSSTIPRINRKKKIATTTISPLSSLLVNGKSRDRTGRCFDTSFNNGDLFNCESDMDGLDLSLFEPHSTLANCNCDTSKVHAGFLYLLDRYCGKILFFYIYNLRFKKKKKENIQCPQF